MNNICLCGWKGSGKTRAAEQFEDEGFVKLKFAAPLKRIVASSFGIKDVEDKTLVVDMSVINYSATAFKLSIAIFKELGIEAANAQDRFTMPSLINTPIPALGGITPTEMLKDLRQFIVKLQLQETEEPVYVRHILQQLGTDIMRDWDRDVHVTLLEEELARLTKPFIVDDARFPNELALMRKYGAKVYWLHRPTLILKDMHPSEVSVSGDDCDETIRSSEGELLDQSVIHYIRYGEWDSPDIM